MSGFPSSELREKAKVAHIKICQFKILGNFAMAYPTATIVMFVVDFACILFASMIALTKQTGRKVNIMIWPRAGCCISIRYRRLACEF